MTGRDWMTRAACRGRDPQAWFPDSKKDDRSLAQQTCAHCPVQAECADYADRLGVTDGIWAGTEIDRPPRSHGGPTGTGHGTNAGARQHYRRGEKPCPPCARAAYEYKRETRRARRTA